MSPGVAGHDVVGVHVQWVSSLSSLWTSCCSRGDQGGDAVFDIPAKDFATEVSAHGEGEVDRVRFELELGKGLVTQGA